MMNRIAALVISTILLTQIASYSFGEITPQVEWEDPLQGDPDWEVTGRNTTSFTETLWGESFETYDANTGATYSEIIWEAYNLANDTNYNVSFDLWEYGNGTDNLTLLYTAANMTNFNSSSTYVNYVYNPNNSTAGGYWTTTYTPPGCYHVIIKILYADTTQLISNYSFDWDVGYCGDETIDINHSGYVWETPNLVEVWDSGTDVHVQFSSGNLEVGESYQLIWNLSDTMWNHGSHGSGVVNWNATSNSNVVNSTISGLADGLYYFYATLGKGGVHVATDDTIIQMGNNTSTGGNNTGGNNTGGNNTGGNTSSNDCGNITNGRLSDNWNLTEIYENYTFELVITADCILDNGTEYQIVNQIWQQGGSSPWHAPTTWQGETVNYNETWTWIISDFNPGTVGGGNWTFISRLFIDTTLVDELTHDYCVNSDTFSCSGFNGTNTDGNNTGGNNSTGLIFIESIWTNWSSSDSYAIGEVQDIGDEWTAYWGVYNGEYSSDTFGSAYFWNYSNGWWEEPGGSGGVSGEIGTLNSSGETFWQVENLNTWAAHPVDLCGTFVIALFEGNLGVASGQNTPATTHPISYDSMIFGPEECGTEEPVDYSIEMYNYPQYIECVLDSFTINATLYDPHNLSNGSTNLTVEISQDIYDSNGTLLDHLSGQVILSVPTNVTFDNYGFGHFSVEISTDTLADGEYKYAIVVGNTTYFYIGTFEVGCSGCGYNSSLINSNYEVWSNTFGTLFGSWNDWNETTNSSNSVNDDTPQIYQGDSLNANIWFSCLVHGEDYLANLTVTNEANMVVYSNEENFTQSSWSDWYNFYESGISTALLPPGEYCLTFTLYMSPFGSSDIVYTITECVEVVPLEDWDGCGSNLTYLEHIQTVNGNPFVQQGMVFLTTSEIWYNNFVDCLVIGENYTMVSTVTHDGSQYMQTSDDFTVNQFSDVTQWSWGDISNWNSETPVGNYCVETTIHSTDSTYTNLIAMVSTVTDCFAVVEVSNNWGDDWWDDQTNNTTGSPNNPIMPDTNCSDLNNSLTGLNLTNSFNMTDCENGTGFWFNLTVNGTGVNWYDPVYAVGYDFEVLSGPKFASVVVPPGYGDDKYDIYLWDGSEYVLAASDLDALTQYWFTDDGQITTTPGDYDGITMFSIRGLELDAKLDPDDPNAFVTGLTFVQDPNEVSEVVLSMNPIRVSDEDDDGIADDDDNCVNDANADQADFDGNGVGDVCETSAPSGGSDDGDSDKSDDKSSNKTLAYAALLAVALVAVLVLFGREKE